MNENKRKVVFMTGAGGGMGSESFKQMLPDVGKLYDLVVFDRDTSRNHDLFDRYKGTKGLTVVYGDLLNKADVEKCVAMSDMVLHIAAFVSPQADYHPDKAMKTNYGSVVNLIEAIKKQKKEETYKFVYIGTVAETGDRMPPIHWGRVGDPIKPSMYDYYAVSKIAAERYVIESGLKYWVSLRQTGIMGPNMAKIRDAIQFHNCIYNVLEYASDRDSGRAMRNLASFDAQGTLEESFWGHIYNIGGGESCRVSTLDMYKAMYGELGFKSLDPVIDPKMYATRNFHGQYYLDSDKLENYLHFRSDSMQYFYDAYLKELGGAKAAGKVITRLPGGQKLMGRIIKGTFKKLLDTEHGTKHWLDQYDEVRKKARKEYFRALKKEAREKHENPIMYLMGKELSEPCHGLSLESEGGETCIYVISRNSGEGSDRKVCEGDVKLTKSEVRDIHTLNKIYKRFMLVLNVGGPVDLSPVMETGNILILSQLCSDMGKVLADILTGKQNPSGKLTSTWAPFEEYSGEGTFGDFNDNEYREGIYVGYRYFDSFGKKALFPFGFGLSYTTFDIKIKNVSARGTSFDIKAAVKNTGSAAGKEAVQVYVSLPEGKLDKAYQELAGFTKTKLLAPGEEEEVSISFDLKDISSYDEATATYTLEKGEYIVRAGNCSADTEVVCVAGLDETAPVLRTRNCLGNPGFRDITAPSFDRGEVPADARRILIEAKDISCTEVSFDREYEIDGRVKKLSDEELCFLEIGGFDPKARGLSIIGNAATHVAGAAGETTSQLEKKGIKPLIMADGPAGLRLSPEYYEDEKGAHGVNGAGMIPESMQEAMGPVAGFIAKLLTGGNKTPKGAVIKEHAATRIPIGTAIAQSFNVELAERFGDIVGDEMERMGINLWLAPALNIHRSILCGRNFEYYSEDPLVSGLMAAAITRGVQKHSGCGTTIKHYAANNAETNRYCNNSHVSERAMREIYLRGFGICVRQAQPHAVMTSYNLLNGIHTAEHRGLIEDVLRCEFGFRGIVMTDWVMTMMDSKNSVYRNSLSNEVARAGGDLFMPGGRKDYENVRSALKAGTLDRHQLQINATRVVRMAERLTLRQEGVIL